jgi:hypothetical protein
MLPEMVRPAELSALDVDLSRPGGTVIPIGSPPGRTR